MKKIRWEIFDEADAGPIPPMDSAPIGGIDFASHDDALAWLGANAASGQLGDGIYGVRLRVEE